MFEEAKAVKDQLGFMNEVKRELDELFAFLEEFKKETGTSLIIVLFVDDLDRCLGGKNVKVLEAIQLMLSIPGVPVLVFLAIDSRVVVASIEESFGEILRGAYISGWEVRVSAVLCNRAIETHTFLRTPSSCASISTRSSNYHFHYPSRNRSMFSGLSSHVSWAMPINRRTSPNGSLRSSSNWTR